MKETDRRLGMDRDITRRDFLNGTSVAIGGSLLAAGTAGASPATPGATAKQAGLPYPKTWEVGNNYPPRLLGMRGSHPGSFEAAHAVRDGKRYDDVTDLDETYDLIVVGGGLSGLAAAYYFKKALPESKILILDNHDDFGGQAKRNEFEVDGHTVVTYGGSVYMTGAYTPEGLTMLQDIGLDWDRFNSTTSTSYELYGDGYGGVGTMDLQAGVLFDRETFGEDHLAVGEPQGRASAADWERFLAGAPLSPQAKRDIVRLYTENADYLPGLDREEKIAKLRRMSYQDYILDVVGVTPEVVPYFLKQTLGGPNGAAGIDSLSAYVAFRHNSLPGLRGLGLGDRPARSWLGDTYNPLNRIHFPDGNAGLARLIVRWLNAEALPGHTMEDSVTTPVRYERLDRPDDDVRIRLNSTVINATHVGDRRTASEVAVTYVTGDTAYRVRGSTCVLACYNAVIPHIVRDLPQEQKDALHMAVRTARVYTNVLIRNWRAFVELGINGAHCPGSFHQFFSLSWTTRIGDYDFTESPDQPIVVRMNRDPIAPGLNARDQFRAGRENILATSFEDFERNIRDQLNRALGAGGFDAADDILAIMVNRWPHGYAGAANELYDPDWGYDEPPWLQGRKRFGRITIANSDAAAICLAQAAFDQAHRAVNELMTDVIRPEFQYPWAERT